MDTLTIGSVVLSLFIGGIITWWYFNKNSKPNGRLVFVTGPSGAGKTTLGETLKTRHDFIHFDGDQFSYGQHPVNDSGSAIRPESLGKRSKELVDAFDNLAVSKGYRVLFKGEKAPLSVWTPFYDLMIKEIQKVRSKHKEKDMVITQSLYPRIVRDYLRVTMGDELKFIVINTDKDLLVQRIMDRDEKKGKEAGFKNLEEYIKSFGRDTPEPLEWYKKDVTARLVGFDQMEQDEPNTYQIDVDEKVTLNDVYVETKKILSL